MLVLMGLLVSGCLSDKTEDIEQDENSLEDMEAEPSSSIMVSEEEVENQEDKVNITLYFADAEDAKLVDEKRFVSKDKAKNTEELVQVAMDELFKGPIGGNLSIPFPKDVEVPTVKVKGGIAIVDFSKGFVEKHPGGSTGENLTVYSIVNTLTSIEGINGVQFTIEGKKTPEFKGHLEFDKVFEANIEE
jgi:germination protein M